MQQRLHDMACAQRVTKKRQAEMTIENVIAALLARRYGIKQSKDHVLAYVVAVIVREVAARMPAFYAHGATL